MAWIFYDDGEPEAEEYITNYHWVGPQGSRPDNKILHQTVLSLDQSATPKNKPSLKEKHFHAKAHS